MASPSAPSAPSARQKRKASSGPPPPPPSSTKRARLHQPSEPAPKLKTKTETETKTELAEEPPLLFFSCKTSHPYHQFSNWSATPYTLNGQTYPTLEHGIMAAKAHVFGDARTEALLLAPQAKVQEALGLKVSKTSKARQKPCTPQLAKALGRKVTPFNDRLWRKSCEELVLPHLIAKFSSTPQLRALLLGTGNRLLAEASKRDKRWGIGHYETAALKLKPSEWKGENLLGKLLMRAREYLRAQAATDEQKAGS